MSECPIYLNSPCLNFTVRPERRRGRRTRQADTNVLAVKFNKLTDPSNIHTGDAVVCGNAQCTAILSHLSKISDNEDAEKDEKVQTIYACVSLGFFPVWYRYCTCTDLWLGGMF